jgi:DNA repair protein RadC
MTTSNTTIPMFVREAGRRYRPATRDEILVAAGSFMYRQMLGETLRSPDHTSKYLTSYLGKLDYEVFGVILLDNRHRIIHVEELFRGTIDGASVHPREVVRLMILHTAAAIVLFHDPPSGNPEPSQADELITHRIRDAVGLIDARLLDHFIAAADRTVSFAARGLL